MLFYKLYIRWNIKLPPSVRFYRCNWYCNYRILFYWLIDHQYNLVLCSIWCEIKIYSLYSELCLILIWNYLLINQWINYCLFFISYTQNNNKKQRNIFMNQKCFVLFFFYGFYEVICLSDCWCKCICWNNSIRHNLFPFHIRFRYLIHIHHVRCDRAVLQTDLIWKINFKFPSFPAFQFQFNCMSTDERWRQRWRRRRRQRRRQQLEFHACVRYTNVIGPFAPAPSS